MTSRAKLPKDLEVSIASQLNWVLPSVVDELSLVNVLTAEQDLDPSASDGTNVETTHDDYLRSRRLEDLKAESHAYSGFVSRLDNLDEDDLTEMTSRISAGLRSWLNFGMTISKNPNTHIGPSAATDTHQKLKDRWKGHELEAQSNKNSGLLALEKSGRASSLMGGMTKGDDKLTRRAEEQANKVCTVGVI